MYGTIHNVSFLCFSENVFQADTKFERKNIFSRKAYMRGPRPSRCCWRRSAQYTIVMIFWTNDHMFNMHTLYQLKLYIFLT